MASPDVQRPARCNYANGATSLLKVEARPRTVCLARDNLQYDEDVILAFELGLTSRARLAGVHPRRAAVGARRDGASSTLRAGRSLVVTRTKTSNNFNKPEGFSHAADLAPLPIDGPPRPLRCGGQVVKAAGLLKVRALFL